MKKRMLSTLLGLGVMIAVGYTTPDQIRANEKSPAFNTLVSRIAQKFKLKESDVKAVFTAVIDERRTAQTTRIEVGLTAAVNDGVISEAQKNELLTMLAEHPRFRGKIRSDIRKWFRDQGLDPHLIKKYLKPNT